MENINLRLATPLDLPTVHAIYRDAIEDMNTRGILQWDEIYPSASLLNEDLARGELYVLDVQTDHTLTILAAVVLNQVCDPAYQTAAWQGAEPYIIVHRLCVSPAAQGMGVGRGLMGAVEAWAKKQGYADIRLDAFSQNPHALRMYDGLGYEKRGEAIWRKGLFYLLEKPIDRL